MKHLMQMVKTGHGGIVPVLERQFLRLYSRWHETHDPILQKRLMMSFNRLLRREPEFDFRQNLW